MTRLDGLVGNSGTLQYSDMKTAVPVFECGCNFGHLPHFRILTHSTAAQ